MLLSKRAARLYSKSPDLISKLKQNAENEAKLRIGATVDKLPTELESFFSMKTNKVEMTRFSENVSFTYLPLHTTAEVDVIPLDTKFTFNGKTNLKRMGLLIRSLLYCTSKETSFRTHLIFKNSIDTPMNESFALKWKLTMEKRYLVPSVLHQQEFNGMLTFLFNEEGRIYNVQVDHMVPPLPTFLRTLLQSSWWTNNPAVSLYKKQN